jgi:hypothetical protein
MNWKLQAELRKLLHFDAENVLKGICIDHFLASLAGNPFKQKT